MKVFAGIVAFRPDPERLLQNIAAVREQVAGVAVFDNGGLDRGILPDGVAVLGEGVNLGIAAALNALCAFAGEQGCGWALTLDQDSVCPEGLVDAYVPYTEDESIGMLCPAVKDRGYGSLPYDGGCSGTEEVDACITSASMIRLSAWEKAGGFREDFFIDMVDFDICWTLKEKGFRILRVNGKSLLQEIGRSRKVRLFGKEEAVFNHSPLRCYYMARNTLALGKIHGRSGQCRRWVLKRMLLIGLYEKDKRRKLCMMLRGWKDYRKGISGKYDGNA